MSDSNQNLKSPDSNSDKSSAQDESPIDHPSKNEKDSNLLLNAPPKDPDLHSGLTAIRKLDKQSKSVFNPLQLSRQNLIGILRLVVRSLVEKSVEIGGSVTDDVDFDTLSSRNTGTFASIKQLLFQLFTVLDHILLHGLIPPSTPKKSLGIGSWFGGNSYSSTPPASGSTPSAFFTQGTTYLMQHSASIPASSSLDSADAARNMNCPSPLLGPDWSAWTMVERLSSTSPPLPMLDDILKSVRETAEIKTGRGRVRAWLRHALMHKYLADYFRAITERGDSFLAEFYVVGAVLRDEESSALVAGQLLALHVLDYQFCVRPTPPPPPPAPSPTASQDRRPASASALSASAHPFDAPVAEIDYASFLNDEQHTNNGKSKETGAAEELLCQLLDQKAYLEEVNRTLRTQITELQSKQKRSDSQTSERKSRSSTAESAGGLIETVGGIIAPSTTPPIPEEVGADSSASTTASAAPSPSQPAAHQQSQRSSIFSLFSRSRSSASAPAAPGPPAASAPSKPSTTPTSLPPAHEQAPAPAVGAGVGAPSETASAKYAAATSGSNRIASIEMLYAASEMKLTNETKRREELEGRTRQLEERLRQSERESAERDELQQLLRSQLEHVKQLGLDLATQLQARDQELNTARSEISNRDNHILELQKKVEDLEAQIKAKAPKPSFGQRLEEARKQNQTLDTSERDRLQTQVHELEDALEQMGEKLRTSELELAAVREREECASLGSVGSASIASASVTGASSIPVASSAALAAAGSRVQGVWQDDAPLVQCAACDKQFNLARRKHHCRLCGGVFCSDCTEQRLQLPGAMCVSPPGAPSVEGKVVRVRVCQRCFGLYKAE